MASGLRKSISRKIYLGCPDIFWILCLCFIVRVFLALVVISALSEFKGSPFLFSWKLDMGLRWFIKGLSGKYKLVSVVDSLASLHCKSRKPTHATWSSFSLQIYFFLSRIIPCSNWNLWLNFNFFSLLFWLFLLIVSKLSLTEVPSTTSISNINIP